MTASNPQLAYGVAHDMAQARRWLQQSLRAWPAVLWQGDWATWAARSAVGHDQVQRIKQKLRVQHA